MFGDGAPLMPVPSCAREMGDVPEGAIVRTEPELVDVLLIYAQLFALQIT
jgi:hypothetical protein